MAKKVTKRVRRDIWNDPRTSAAIALAYARYTHGTIAKLVGLTQPAVSYRLGKHGVSTSECRRAEDPVALEQAREIVHAHVKHRKGAA